MSVAPMTETPLIDPKTGQLRPISEEERKAQVKAVKKMLAEIDAITDETDADDESWDEVLRRIAAARSGEAS